MGESTSNIIVSVVILGWNGKRFLQDFLPSVVKYSAHPNYEVVYADNASTDESVAFVKGHFPTVRIVQNTTNKGFAAGYNEALKGNNAKYYVLLNQDVEVTEGWLEPLLALGETSQKIAAVQPKVRSYKAKEYFEYAGAAGGMVDWMGYAYCRGRLFDTMEIDTGQYDSVRQIFWASGAAMFVRSQAYWQAGGLDPDFFAHQEEIDLCWRMQNLGYKIMAAPSAVVYHVGGGSLPQGNPTKTYLNFRNNLMMLYKNLPKHQLIWKLPFRLVLDVVAAIYSMVKNKNLKDFRAIFRANRDFLKELPSLSVKRQAIPKKSPNLLSDTSVVFQHFIMKKQYYSQL